MKKTENWINYENRLNRVNNYIHEHLDEDIDLNKLAEVACMSPYHWHRIYHAVFGETIAAAVKRMRLHRAAGYLAHTDKPVPMVATSCGYVNVQSFTRIFKSVYGMPPATYRQRGSHNKFKSTATERKSNMYEVSRKHVDPIKVIAIDHKGSYMQIGKAFDSLFAWLGARNLFRPGIRTFGIYYDDPASVAENELRSKACIYLGEEIPVDPPMEVIEIQPGNYAVLRYQGPYADMHSAYQWLYGQWLMNSGEEMGHAPCFEEYLNNPRDTAPTDLLTDIHLPLAS